MKKIFSIIMQTIQTYGRLKQEAEADSDETTGEIRFRFGFLLIN